VALDEMAKEILRVAAMFEEYTAGDAERRTAEANVAKGAK
jgi:hypothetical protein